jgi:cytochrome c556
VRDEVMSEQLEQLKKDLTKIQRRITYLMKKTPQGTTLHRALQKLWYQIDDFKAETSE